MGCNTGGDVGGVFMGCDSSKMITRCAKLTGAQCEGEKGETYRCYWNVNNDRTSSVRSDINHGHAEQASMNLDMDSTVVSVAQWNLTAMDVLLALTVCATMAAALHQLYQCWNGGKEQKEEVDLRPESQPLMIDLMENRV